MATQGRRITWIGDITTPITTQMFTDLNTALTTTHGMVGVNIAGPFSFPGGTTAAALYRTSMWTFLVTSTRVYVEVLFQQVPNVAAVTALVPATFALANTEVIEDAIRL